MKEFYPHPSCTVASGDCFTIGRCLGGCKTSDSGRIDALEKRIAVLERKMQTKTTSTVDEE